MVPPAGIPGGWSPDRERPFQHFQECSRATVGACQTILDGFWENTYSFGLLLTRYRDDVIDMLAGHVWDGEQYKALSVMQKTLAEQPSA
jgi:hypothetical protein